ncbi:N-acyl-D-amino-acid deacylase family protein [Defluviitalea phaphyphila]|uniref:N-acyl-D-amino-acid deacylase family protein n=1 Tax=Defluviitalea phaphyphila TaxID=1473580 RepID=UPI0007312DF3|nr:D-aminoacylase [Defluviitalea phaphyphila]
MLTKIENAIIIDGSGEKSYKGSIAIQDDLIIGVGNVPDLTYDIVIDAKGKVVSPGFIDTHSHSDLMVFEDPRILPKIMQGITTEVLGQDGISMAPLPEKYIDVWRRNISGINGYSDKIDWNYKTTKGYLKLLYNVKPGSNLCYLIPHGNVRMEVMGLDDRPATEQEIEKMKDVIRREMESGAIGMSTGLIYTPCTYANTKELIELCKAVKEYDGIFVTHQRSEGNNIIKSMEETFEIGEKSGVKIHFSHFKICSKKLWDKAEYLIEMIHKAEKEGISVSFDQYPYIAGSTTLGVILPPWVHDGGNDKLMERLKDPVEREKITEDIKTNTEWDNFIDFAGFDKIFITSVTKKENEKFLGKSLLEIAEMQGKDPYNASYDLILDEQNSVGMVDYYGTEENVKLFIKCEEMNLCTDGLLGPGKPHPRVYGSFPRFLRKYYREEKIISLEEAIRKMTGKAADTFNLKKRGYLKKGYYADLVIFDPNTIADVATFENPIAFPVGIDYVFVNGIIEVENSNHTGKRNGSVIYR